ELPLADAFGYAAPSSLVGAALFFSCLGGSVATVVAEREQQTLKRLFISPLSGISYFLGIFLAHTCIGLGQTLLVYTVAAFWGATFNGSILLGLTIIIMSIVAYVGLGFILGTQLARRIEDVNALVAAFGVPLLILGGAFLPASLFPQSLINIARYNPIYHMNEALVGVSSQGGDLSKIQSHFSFLLVFAFVMVIGGWLSYRRMLVVERRL
ncbi:ABC transporter permease, partial [Nodularia sphaerocarpa]